MSSTEQYIQDASSNNSSLAISTDKIGIGTITPDERLQVNGNIRVDDGSGVPGENRVWATEKVFNVLDYGAVPLVHRATLSHSAGNQPQE